MLRRLADNIESGDEPADEVFCIRRHGINGIAVYDWGEYRGNIACLGLLEAAKKIMPVFEEDVDA